MDEKESLKKTKSFSILQSVPEAGVEPARPYGQRILSPLRLPIPPLGLKRNIAKVV